MEQNYKNIEFFEKVEGWDTEYFLNLKELYKSIKYSEIWNFYKLYIYKIKFNNKTKTFSRILIEEEIDDLSFNYKSFYKSIYYFKNFYNKEDFKKWEYDKLITEIISKYWNNWEFFYDEDWLMDCSEYFFLFWNNMNEEEIIDINNEPNKYSQLLKQLKAFN